MNEDILSLVLLFVVLTFHGTEAFESSCKGLCESACRSRGDEGLNCCAGTKGGRGGKPRGAHGPDQSNGKYDPVCREGTCNLRYKDWYRYVQSLKILISPSPIFILYFHYYDALIQRMFYIFLECVKRHISVVTWSITVMTHQKSKHQGSFKNC